MRRFLFCSFIVLSFFVSGQVNLDSGLVACYPLNGHAVDMINGYDGTLSGWILNAPNKNMKANSALQFQATTTTYMELPGNSQLKPNAISFGAWVRPNNTTASSSYIVFTKNSAALTTTVDPAAYALILETINAGKKIKVVKRTSTQTFTLANSTNLSNNLWYHVCFTMDNTEIKLYLNGVQTGTLAAIGAIDYQSGKKVFMAASNETVGSSPFLGSIDNVRFYNRVLTSAEVLYLAQNDPACIPATQAPVAGFSIWGNCVGETIRLIDTSSNNPHSWFWKVSAAGLVNPYLPNPTLSIGSPGPITTTLITSNDLGTDTIIKTIQIYPEAKISVVPSMTYICRNEVYILTAHNNAMPTFTWNGTVVSPTISGSHNLVGTYTQSVAGFDTMGCAADTVFYVKVNYCHPFPNFIVENELNEFFKIYPNPSNGSVAVQLLSTAVVAYKIFNLTGVLIQEGKIEQGVSKVVDITKQPDGIYFLQLKVDDKTIIKKIIKSD